MTEDDIYRTSTQYRLWSFTSEALGSIRLTTNALAADRVRAAIKRKQEARTAERSTSGGEPAGAGRIEENETNGNAEGSGREKQVECLTVEEEQKLVGFYCVKAMELADFCNFPTNVKVFTSPSPPALPARAGTVLIRNHRQRPSNTSNASTCPTPP